MRGDDPARPGNWAPTNPGSGRPSLDRPAVPSISGTLTMATPSGPMTYALSPSIAMRGRAVESGADVEVQRGAELVSGGAATPELPAGRSTRNPPSGSAAETRADCSTASTGRPAGGGDVEEDALLCAEPGVDRASRQPVSRRHDLEEHVPVERHRQLGDGGPGRRVDDGDPEPALGAARPRKTREPWTATAWIGAVAV